jgi:hypothetical protein
MKTTSNVSGPAKPYNSASTDNILFQQLEEKAQTILNAFQEKEQKKKKQQGKKKQQPTLFDEMKDKCKLVLADSSEKNSELRKSLFGDSHSSLTQQDHLLGAALHKWYHVDRANEGDLESRLLKLTKSGKHQIDIDAAETLAKSLKAAIHNTVVSCAPKKRYIDEAQTNIVFGLTRVVAFVETSTSLHSRHVFRSPHSHFSVTPSTSVADILEDLGREKQICDIPALLVLIVGGSSGSGKTIFALHAAKMCGWGRNSLIRENRNVVFYFIASKLEWKEKENDDLMQLTGVDEETKRKIRNGNLKKALMSAIDAALAKLDGGNKFDVDDRKDSNYKIVVVIDEAGPRPMLVRALCSGVVEIGTAVHNRFFPEVEGTQTTTAAATYSAWSRVRFIIAGTGLAMQNKGHPDSSSTEQSTSVLLDNEELAVPFSHMIREFFSEEEMTQPSFAGTAKALRRLCASSNAVVQNNQIKFGVTRSNNQEKVEVTATSVEALTETELISRSLVKNPRCAALLLRGIRNTWSPIKSDGGDPIIFPEFDAIYQQLLTGLLPQVVREYFVLNGLRYFKRPCSVLLAALSAVIFRLPQLPATPMFAENNKKLEAPHAAMCTRGGVLVDLSLETLKKIPNENQSDYFQTFDGRWAPKTGRYLFSDAHVAMLQILFNLPRRPYTPDGLELAVGDFCTLVSACAPFYIALKNGNPQNPSNVNSDSSDPLLPLRQALVFECIKPETMKVLYLHNKEQLAKRDVYKETLDFLDDDEYCGSVKNGSSVVVVVSAPLDPYADVVVLGPNRLILIQVKSRRTESKVDFDEELCKMGLQQNKNKSLPTDTQTNLLEKLIDLCRVNGSNNKVDVKAFLVQEDEASAVPGNNNMQQQQGNAGASTEGTEIREASSCPGIADQNWTATKIRIKSERSTSKNVLFPAPSRTYGETAEQFSNGNQVNVKLMNFNLPDRLASFVGVPHEQASNFQGQDSANNNNSDDETSNHDHHNNNNDDDGDDDAGKMMMFGDDAQQKGRRRNRKE